MTCKKNEHWHEITLTQCLISAAYKDFFPRVYSESLHTAALHGTDSDETTKGSYQCSSREESDRAPSARRSNSHSFPCRQLQLTVLEYIWSIMHHLHKEHAWLVRQIIWLNTTNQAHRRRVKYSIIYVVTIFYVQGPYRTVNGKSHFAD